MFLMTNTEIEGKNPRGIKLFASNILGFHYPAGREQGQFYLGEKNKTANVAV